MLLAPELALAGGGWSLLPQGELMTATTEQISQLLHEAGETHHRVFRIVDGADDGAIVKTCGPEIFLLGSVVGVLELGLPRPEGYVFSSNG